MQVLLKDIQKSFKEVQALKGVDLTIESGEFLSILGPSGCGKTTLLRILAGLEKADKGSIHFGEKTVVESDQKMHLPPQERNIGMVFQDFALWPHMTVFENVAYGLKAKGKKKNRKEKVEQALKDVQLEHFGSRYPHELSGGQQQRVAFARAVANEPEIILLDEPLSALDAALRDDMRVLLKKLVKKRNLTAIYVTHDQHEAMALSDRIAVIQQGEILQLDSPEAIYHRPINIEVARFVGRGTCLPVEIRNEKWESKLFISGEYEWETPEKISGATEGLAIIRPENVHIHAEKKEKCLPVMVEAASYLGERYEISLSLEVTEELLLAYSSKSVAIGQKVWIEYTGKSLTILEMKGSDQYVEKTA